jgi:hypothetical protein
MAQIIGVLGSPANTAQGGIPPGMLKVGALTINNGAAETGITIDWAAYGFSVVIAYGITPRDTFTNTGGPHANHTGTSVVYTWIGADVLNVIVWALGH